MALTILPMTAHYLQDAAALLAARHRRDQRCTPELSQAFAESQATLPVLRELLAQEGMRGVVALQGGHLVGYLCGRVELRSPTRTFAGFMRPRAIDIPYDGHATVSDDDGAVMAQLYAALSRDWVAQGLLGHYVTTPARPETGDLWNDLGFGRFLALGVRPTTATAAPLPTDVTVRRATMDDEAMLQEAMPAFFHTFADPPIFVPDLPETAAARREFVSAHLADPACPVWLAYGRDQQVLGFQMFVEPSSALWDPSPLESPPHALYLHIAYTQTGQRSTGIGAALLAQTMAWAHDAGHESCLAHWATASRAAPFWQRQSFRPISYYLCRPVDERAAWISSRG